MDVLALKAMIVIEPVGIDERRAALSILGQNLLGMMGMDLFTQVRQFCPSGGQRDDVFCRDCQDSSFSGRYRKLYRILSIEDLIVAAMVNLLGRSAPQGTGSVYIVDSLDEICVAKEERVYSLMMNLAMKWWLAAGSRKTP